MIIQKCKSLYGECPCIVCERKKCYGCVDHNMPFDTKNLCVWAKAYCEKVNREEKV